MKLSAFSRSIIASWKWAPSDKEIDEAKKMPPRQRWRVVDLSGDIGLQCTKTRIIETGFCPPIALPEGSPFRIAFRQGDLIDLKAPFTDFVERLPPSLQRKLHPVWWLKALGMTLPFSDLCTYLREHEKLPQAAILTFGYFALGEALEKWTIIRPLIDDYYLFQAYGGNLYSVKG